MSHRASTSFWEEFEKLPIDTQALARKNFALLQENPRHLSLSFKKVGKVWSVRVGSNYRAVAVERDYGFLWIWIANHADYDRLSKNN